VSEAPAKKDIFADALLSFFPSAVTGWNSLDLAVRKFVSLPTFKAKLRSTLFPHSFNKLFDFSFSMRASIDHTRLRLGFSCLRKYLLKIYRLFASAVLTLNGETLLLVLPQVCRSK